MVEINSNNLIRLSEDDLDQPVYRIYSLDRFVNILNTKNDALVSPAKWEDPFEDFFLRQTEVQDPVNNEVFPLSNLAADWYGQCWSLNEETDAMWRIYSPDPKTSVGIKAKTTIRKLFKNLIDSGSGTPDLQFFVGKVDYMSENDIRKLMSQLTFFMVTLGGQGDGFAKLQCIKRTAFEHEAEVRLLFQDIEPKRGSNDIVKFALDANLVFDEVVLDPRLDDNEAKNIEVKLQNFGCTLTIRKSRLYESPRFVIKLQ